MIVKYATSIKRQTVFIASYFSVPYLFNKRFNAKYSGYFTHLLSILLMFASSTYYYIDADSINDSIYLKYFIKASASLRSSIFYT